MLHVTFGLALSDHIKRFLLYIDLNLAVGNKFKDILLILGKPGTLINQASAEYVC